MHPDQALPRPWMIESSAGATSDSLLVLHLANGTNWTNWTCQLDQLSVSESSEFLTLQALLVQAPENRVPGRFLLTCGLCRSA